MQKNLRLIARPIVARHECTYVRHCKENAPIYMYNVAPETPMMSSVIADCRDLAPPNILDKSTPMVTRPSFSGFRPMLPVGLPAVAEVRNDNFTGDAGTVSSYGTLTHQSLTTNLSIIMTI